MRDGAVKPHRIAGLLHHLGHGGVEGDIRTAVEGGGEESGEPGLQGGAWARGREEGIEGRGSRGGPWRSRGGGVNEGIGGYRSIGGGS